MILLTLLAFFISVTAKATWGMWRFLTGPAWGIWLKGDMECRILMALCGVVDVDHWVVVYVGVCLVLVLVLLMLISIVIICIWAINIIVILPCGLAYTICRKEYINRAVLSWPVIPPWGSILSQGQSILTNMIPTLSNYTLPFLRVWHFIL